MPKASFLPTKKTIKKEPLPAKIPTAVPVKKIPTPVAVKKTPKPVPVKKTPKPIPVKKTPTPTPVKKTPAPVKKTPSPIPVKKTSTPVPIKKTPTPVPVKKTPKPVPIKKTSTPVPVKKTPPPAPVKKTPTPVSVKKTPTPVKKSSVPVKKNPVLPRTIARDNNFFHEHALHTLTVEEQDHIKCNVCDTAINGEVYGCDKFARTKFYIHKTCVNLPKTICHPSHVVASLNLRAHAPNQQGEFFCKACGEKCDSFHYHSNDNFDLHIGCAALPSSVTYNQHTFLNLRYNFPLPCEPSTVKCNICNHPLLNSRWVYYNVTPKFIAHLSCALKGNDSTAIVIQQQLNAMVPISSRPPTKSFCSRIFGC